MITMLTPKQQNFVRELLSGKTQADAYRYAYQATRMNDNSVRREASRLMANPNITTTVRRLQDQADDAVIEKRIATRQDVLETLSQCMDNAKTGDSVRVRAAELLGKHYGLFVEKVDPELEIKSSEELAQQLNDTLLRVGLMTADGKVDLS